MNNIVKYNLSNFDDSNKFNEFKVNALNILGKAYGPKYFGDAVYNQKLSKNAYLIYLYLFKNEPQGILIRKQSGKLIALAVLPQFQRKGIGSKLLRTVQNENTKLFGEVCSSNKKMVRLMKQTGFQNIGKIHDPDNRVCQDENQIKFIFEYIPHLQPKKRFSNVFKKATHSKLKKIKKSILRLHNL